MSLGKKIFLIFIAINFISLIVIQGSSYLLTSSTFKNVLGGMENSLKEMQTQTAGGFRESGRESAQNLVQLIKISVGESLQPGESEKFLFLARQLAAVKGLAEFSFFGPDGLIELSSVAEAKGRKVSPQVWDEGKRTRQMVVNEDEDAIMLYEPLFADRDMIRFHPEWEAGKFYGMLFVKISKERQNRIETQANQTIQNAITNGNNTYSKSSHQVFWVILSIICRFDAPDGGDHRPGDPGLRDAAPGRSRRDAQGHRPG